MNFKEKCACFELNILKLAFEYSKTNLIKINQVNFVTKCRSQAILLTY